MKLNNPALEGDTYIGTIMGTYIGTVMGTYIGAIMGSL